MRVFAVLTVAAVLAAPSPTLQDADTQMKKLTPVLLVDAIEPVLPFWEERLGFTRSNEVPLEDKLAFVTLSKDGVEIMYQTVASMTADFPAVASIPLGGNLLFIEVQGLDAIVAALEGIEPVVPRRKTFYGADEFVVREPGGNTVRSRSSIGRGTAPECLAPFAHRG